MKRILAVILIALGIGLGVVGLQQPSAVFADSKADVCAGVGAVSGTTGCTGSKTDPTVNGIATTIVNFMSALVGLLSVVMIIWGGFRYVTSGGDSGKITSARTTIVYALVGLAIVALAQTIVKFVITKTVG